MAMTESTTKPIHVHSWQVGFVSDGSVQVAIEDADGASHVFQFTQDDFYGFADMLQDAKKEKESQSSA
jgi:hypothetical protein